MSEIQRRYLDPVLQILGHMIDTELGVVYVELSPVVNIGHIHKLFPQPGLLVHVIDPFCSLQLICIAVGM